ncbi:GrpB family protein [uncultured Aeromicrobium sp.]|uniref:GrpB family protein n=1 Tax=uncultured Aeromicrobium sp. TaxID=337820 RepID=UPI0025FF0C93|nr:GrpB family protein [uncultured Aeromicrobium sp.]
MPTVDAITTFLDSEPPPGSSPWVVDPPVRRIEVVDPDPSWPAVYEHLKERICSALGAHVLDIAHVGSTAVAGLPAKPVIDIDVIVADPSQEDAWLPVMESTGLVLTVRESWWYEHRCLTASEPAANVHVFGPESPEPWRHRIFRDHLRRHRGDRGRYAEAKRVAAVSASELAETMDSYNRRKESVIREIYARAFDAAGLCPRTG